MVPSPGVRHSCLLNERQRGTVVGSFPSFPEPLTIESGQPHQSQWDASLTYPRTRCQMLTSYFAAATLGWMLLVLLFFMAHAPQKTLAEVIRDVKSSR